MRAELRESPEAVARFLDREATGLRRLGATLRDRAPGFFVTCARGSSDHAAFFFKYGCEIMAGLPVASLGPSVASIYGGALRLGGAALISVSQSGRSPDLLALQEAARKGGALAIAVVNDAASPLADGADAVLPLHAGPETSVAATKSCLVSAVALAALLAAFLDDATLHDALAALPGRLTEALAADWSEAAPVLSRAESAYVIGRGPAFPVALEAALKLKETAVLHAEAFSGAEVMHGPLQLLHEGFPVIAFRPADAAHGAMGEAVARLRDAGGRVLVAEAGPGAPGRLAVPDTGHWLLDPLPMLLAFYGLAETVARARGHDPDKPAHLRKVTRTL